MPAGVSWFHVLSDAKTLAPPSSAATYIHTYSNKNNTTITTIATITITRIHVGSSFERISTHARICAHASRDGHWDGHYVAEDMLWEQCKTRTTRHI